MVYVLYQRTPVMFAISIDRVYKHLNNHIIDAMPRFKQKTIALIEINVGNLFWYFFYFHMSITVAGMRV